MTLPAVFAKNKRSMLPRQKKAFKTVEKKKVSRKCPKSISLDSGLLDKPFGPLIFQSFQYVKAFLQFCFDRFLDKFFLFPLKRPTAISLRDPLLSPLGTLKGHPRGQPIMGLPSMLCIYIYIMYIYIYTHNLLRRYT